VGAHVDTHADAHIGQPVEKLELGVRVDVLEGVFVEPLQLTGFAVNPGDGMAGFSGVGDHLLGATGAAGGQAVPERHQKLALGYGLNAAVVVLLVPGFVPAGDFNGDGLLHDAHSALPRRFLEVGAELLGGAGQKDAQGNVELETALRKELIAARCGRGDAAQDAVVRLLLPRKEVANHLTALGLVGNLAMTGKADGQHRRKLHERIGSLGI